jgi:hypothetical protein
MTTITITSALVGKTVAQNGVLSAIRYLVAGGEMHQKFTLVDDAAPYDAVPRQIYNSDLLNAGTNQNGTLQSPVGVLFEDASINFGNLTVAACPANGGARVRCHRRAARRRDRGRPR